MQINIIACLDQNGAIGYKNQLIFHIRKDMERFKQLTLNHTIVMGRKTYDSLPHGALPLRRNIVITQQEIQLENCEVYHSLTDALDKCTDDIIFIIGGESIYKQCLNLADNLYLTIVDKKMPKADTYFPSINSENWEIIDKEQFKEIDDAKKEIFSFSFITFKNNRKSPINSRFHDATFQYPHFVSSCTSTVLMTFFVSKARFFGRIFIS